MNRLQTERGEELQLEMAVFWEENPDEQELLATFDGRFIGHAIFMAEHGVSHRPVPLQVGAVLPVMTSLGPVLFEGYNNSPYPGAPKVCAETDSLAMGNALIARLNHRESLTPVGEAGILWRAMKAIVAASSHEDTNYEVNNLWAPTLHLCRTPCLRTMQDHPSIPGDMPIDTVAVDLDNHTVLHRERHTVESLLALYEHVPVPPISKELLARDNP